MARTPRALAMDKRTGPVQRGQRESEYFGAEVTFQWRSPLFQPPSLKITAARYAFEYSTLSTLTSSPRSSYT